MKTNAMTIREMLADLKDFQMSLTEEEWKDFVQSIKDSEVKE